MADRLPPPPRRQTHARQIHPSLPGRGNRRAVWRSRSAHASRAVQHRPLPTGLGCQAQPRSTPATTCVPSLGADSVLGGFSRGFFRARYQNGLSGHLLYTGNCSSRSACSTPHHAIHPEPRGGSPLQPCHHGRAPVGVCERPALGRTVRRWHPHNGRADRRLERAGLAAAARRQADVRRRQPRAVGRPTGAARVAGRRVAAAVRGVRVRRPSAGTGRRPHERP